MTAGWLQTDRQTHRQTETQTFEAPGELNDGRGPSVLRITRQNHVARGATILSPPSDGHSDANNLAEAENSSGATWRMASSSHLAAKAKVIKEGGKFATCVPDGGNSFGTIQTLEEA